MNEVISMKTAIRERIRKERGALDTRWARQASRSVHEHATALSEYACAHAVGAYFAMPGEVQTAELLERCWRDGKEVCVPAFEPDFDAYIFTGAHASSVLREGMLGIPEPETHSLVEANAMTVVFVPGVAFDAHGGRVGHGAGHYDALLRDWASAFKIGLAFDFQIVDRVPTTPGDIAMDAVVTNSKIMLVEKQKT